jgi:putative cardiolipin synthase
MKRSARPANTLTLTIALCVAAFVARADKVRILERSDDASQARIDLIQQAKHSIDAQYYIVGNDYFTLAGLALLRDAARRGCKVRLIIDAQSNKIPPAVHSHLSQEKVLVKLYHPFTLRRLGWVTHRMHDKGLNVDGRKMIRGGRNIEGDYFGYAAHNFVDRDVYVEGNSPRVASEYFDELWNSAEVGLPRINSSPAQAEEGRKILDDARQRLRARKGAKLNSGTDWGARAREVRRVEFLHDAVGQKDFVAGIAQELRRKLRQTRSSILIETPYLVPTKLLLADLADVKRKGVKKIELVTNSLASNDSTLVQLGYEVGKKDLQERGAELWEFKGPDTLHAKSAVLDNRVALIGSFNIDPRSQHLNTETAVAIEDEVTARQLARNINAHKTRCIHVRDGSARLDQPMSKTPLGKRIKMSLLKLILPLVRGQL